MLHIQKTTLNMFPPDCFSSCKLDSLCQAASIYTNLTCKHFSQFSSLVESNNTITEIMNCTNEMMISLTSKLS